MSGTIVHITWPDDRPARVEASIHHGHDLETVAESVMRKSASHGHIVMAGARTWLLGGELRRLEYAVLVTLQSGFSMAWRHVFAFAGTPWSTDVEEPGYVVWWRPSDVDDQGNVQPVAVATLGVPQPDTSQVDLGWHIEPCTNQPCCTALTHIHACPSTQRRQEAEHP